MNAVVSEKHLFKMKARSRFAFLFDKHSLFYFVILLICVGLGFFALALLSQKFTTPFGGDFAQQYYAFEYNFYDDWWTFFRTGKFLFFDTNTFLGADNVISNTYYGLFSPFTFPILFFPRSFLPHAMALVTIAKLVTGALLFRVFLKYMGVTESTARIFAIAYAFMGWTGYYLWFNNFAEVLAFFPLILFGIEKIIREKKIWACSLGYSLIGLGNYFFLLTFGIFGVIYAGFRFFQTLKERGGIKNYKEHLIVLGLGIAGFAIGYLMCAVVMVPAIVGSFSISRATEAQYFNVLKQAFADGNIGKAFEIIFTWWDPDLVTSSNPDPSKYSFMAALPLASFFYPAVSGRYVNIINYSSFNDVGSSIFFFTPCIILFFASMYRSFIHKKISHFIAIGLCVLCLFVPFFYFLSGFFTDNYGRWEIIVPALGLLYIALNFDKREETPRLVIFIAGIIAFLGMILTFILALDIATNYAKGVKSNDNYINQLMGSDMVGVVVYELILCGLETMLFGGLWHKKYIGKMIKFFIIGEAVIMGNLVTRYHGLQSIRDDVNTGLDNMANQIALISEVKAQDPSYYRMVSSMTDSGHVNLPQAEGFNGVTTFHTFYNNNVDDFVHMTDMMSWDGSWSAHYAFKHEYLESFLGVKYYITRDSDTKYYNPDHVYEPNVPLNYSLIKHDDVNGYRVYQNDYHINFGMAYDTLFYKHSDEDNPKYNAFYEEGHAWNNLDNYLRNEEVLFQGAILNDADLDEVISNHPSAFNVVDAVPTLNMRKLDITKKGIYVPFNLNDEGQKEYIYMDPENPTKAIKDEFKLSESPDAPKNTYQIVYEPKYTSAFDIGEEGGYYVLNYPIRNPWSEYNACAWLINKDNKVITFDEVRYTESDNTWVGRALYSKEPVYKIIVCVLGNDYYSSTPDLYYQSFDEVKQTLMKAANNGIKNLSYNVNDFKFETNYDTEKFFVTQLAYTSGWTLKATLSDGTVTYPKVYNAQGGFAGFVAPKGAVKYELSYKTPDIVKWAIVSAAAFMGLGASIVVPIILKKKKEKRIESSN